MDIQMCDDNLSWATLAIGINSLLKWWICTYQVKFSLFSFRFFFIASKSTGSALLQISILIWHAVSVFLISLGGP